MTENNTDRNIDWWEIRDPHPAALPNLRQVVDYMINMGATNNMNTLSVYALAKMLNRQHKQVAMLIKDRPGFVQVIRDGKSLGYYWDRATFGSTYPERFNTFRGKPVKAVEDLASSHIEVIRNFNRDIPEMAKKLRAEADKPDLDLPKFDKQETKNYLVSFSLLPVEIARDMLQTAIKSMASGAPNDSDATDVMTALLSLSAHRKAKDV